MNKLVNQILGNEYNFEKCYTLITGACGGLGRAFVSECAKMKENLILIGTSEKKLESLMSEFSSKFNGIFVRTFVCDLSKPDDIKNLTQKLADENLVVNKLINNAGIIMEGDFEKFSDDEIQKTIMVNCSGTVDLTKKLIKARNKSLRFEVLTVSSVAAYYPIPHMALYAATKSFLLSLMTALADEYKNQNIVFTTVCPGAMKTNDAMKESIKSMGLGGKLSCVSTEKVARKSLRALRRKKRILVPGFFNKLLVLFSKLFSKKILSKSSGKIYKKSQEKRKF